MKVTDFLPIGSIVLLKDGEKKLMITGIMQKDTGGTGKDYDYLGVLYPEGHIGDEYQYLFNHEDIVQIFFRGFEDEEREEFLKKIAACYDCPKEDKTSSGEKWLKKSWNKLWR